MTRQRTLFEFVSNAKPPSSSEITTRVYRKQKKSSAKPTHSSPFKRALSESQSEESQSDDDDDVRPVKLEPATQAELPSSYDEREDAEDFAPPSPVVRKRLRRNQKRAPSTPPSSDSGGLTQSSEEDDVGPTQTRRSRKQLIVIESDEESDQPPKRRKLVKGKGKPSEDEDEDEDLLAEVDSNKIIESRLRSSRKSAYSSKLDELKRRKKGLPPKSQQDVIIIGSDEEDSVEELDFVPFKGSKPNTKRGNEDMSDEDDIVASNDKEGDDDIDGFIVEDDGAEEYELPAQFSSDSHQDLNIHFKVVCQLFVHLATIPPEGRKEFMRASSKNSYFSLPLRTLRRKLSGTRDSLVTSSAWKPDFVKSLKIHPEFEVTDLDYAIPGCDACHMGGRKSMFVGRVSGESYDPDSYEPKEPASDSEDEDEDDDSEAEDKNEFNLGRFCAARAQAYHNFTHWEYKLFTALKDEVETLQNPERVYHQGKAFIRMTWGGGIERPKNVDDPDEIMEWLDRRNIIQAEWSAIKKLMEGAHGLDYQRGKGLIDD